MYVLEFGIRGFQAGESWEFVWGGLWWIIVSELWGVTVTAERGWCFRMEENDRLKEKRGVGTSYRYSESCTQKHDKEYALCLAE